MKFAVVGDPVSHSLSPVMHQAGYDELGLGHSYEAIRVTAGSLASRLGSLAMNGYAGVNVTVPLKEEALTYCRADEFAHRCKAVNCIDLRSGDGINTDGPGFLEVLQELGCSPDSRVLLLGAGGSARALALALTDAGFDVTVWNRTASKAEALAKLVDGRFTADIPEDGYDIAVNATSTSLLSTNLDMVFKSNKLYVDLYYSMSDTPFVEAAKAAGARAIDGRSLLVAQGALAFEWWLGIPAPRQAMRRALGL